MNDEEEFRLVMENDSLNDLLSGGPQQDSLSTDFRPLTQKLHPGSQQLDECTHMYQGCFSASPDLVQRVVDEEVGPKPLAIPELINRNKGESESALISGTEVLLSASTVMPSDLRDHKLWSRPFFDTPRTSSDWSIGLNEIELDDLMRASPIPIEEHVDEELPVLFLLRVLDEEDCQMLLDSFPPLSYTC